MLTKLGTDDSPSVLPWNSTTAERSSSSSPPSLSNPKVSPTDKASVSSNPLSSSQESYGAYSSSLERPRPETSYRALEFSSAKSLVGTSSSGLTTSQSSHSSYSVSGLSAQSTSERFMSSSASIPLPNGLAVSTPPLTAFQESIGQGSPASTNQQLNTNHSSLLSSYFISSPSGLSPTRKTPLASGVGSTKNPSVTNTSQGNRTQWWLNTSAQDNSHGARSSWSHHSTARFAGTAARSGNIALLTMPFATGTPGSTSYGSAGKQHVTMLNATDVGNNATTNSMSANLTLSNTAWASPVTANSTFITLTGNHSFSNVSTLHNPSLANVTISNAMIASDLYSNATLHNSNLANATFTNLTLSGGLKNNSTLHTFSLMNSTFTSPTINNSLATNSTFQNTTRASPSISPSWFITSGNHTIAVTFQPLVATLKAHVGPAGFPLLTSNSTTRCSSTVTKDIQELTTTVTSTILVNETTTLYGTVLTPLPLFISPLPACTTSYLPFRPHQPGGPGTTTSTLLVTKKSPVVIRSPQTVGPIFNIPTTTAQAAAAQPVADGDQAGLSHVHETTPGRQVSEGSDGQPQTHPNGQNVQQTNKENLSPGSAPLQQEFPEVMPAVPSDSVQWYLPQAGTSKHGEHSSGNSNEQPNGGAYPSGNGGQTSNGRQGSGSGYQQSNGGDIPQNGVHASSEGQTSDSNGQPSGGGQESGGNGQMASSGQSFGSGGSGPLFKGGEAPKGVGQMPSGEQTVAGGGHSPSGDGQSASGSKENPSDPGQETAGQTSSSQTLSKGDVAQPQQGNSGTSGFNDIAVQPDNRLSTVPGGNPSSPEGFSQENTGFADTFSDQRHPSAVTIDNVPISIGGSAIIVASRTISVGSPPTTIMADGQPVVVAQSQIVAPGTTIPIAAVVTPPPAVSTVIGGVPVVLQPKNIMIGSQTFNHGSSAAFAVYNGQTYSWDAKQLIGPGGTMVTFPSATPVGPQITAGGQVFSVYSSTLKATGAQILIPSTPEASPFVYRGQTFSVNPSQLMVPDRSIPILLAAQPTPFVYGGQTFSVDNSRFIAPSATLPLSSGSGIVKYNTQVLTVEKTRVVCPSTTIALPDMPQIGTAAGASPVTTGGLTFSLGPQAAVIGASTYSFLPGQTPATITDNGHIVTLDSSAVKFGAVNIPVPTGPSSYSVITQGDLTFSVAPSAVVLESHTYRIQPNIAPTYTVIGSQTISIGTQGIGLASTTIPLSLPSQSYVTVTEGDLTFSVAPSEVLFKGSTFAIGPNMPATLVLGNQAVSFGSTDIYFPGTTVSLPTPTSQETPVAVTADGVTFSVGPTNAIIGGTPYAIGSGAMAKVVTIGSKAVSLGTNGVALPSTTIPPEQTPSAITAEGLTFSADTTEAIINGTAYAIGNEAIAKTIVVGSETIGLGTKGIVLSSTTIAPWGNATQADVASTPGAAAATGGLVAATATSAAPPPTGLPGTVPEGTKNDVHRGIGLCLKPPDMHVLGAILGGLILILLKLT